MTKQALALKTLRFEGLFYQIGAPFYRQISIWYGIMDLFFKCFHRLLRPHEWRWKEISHAIVQMGIGSISMISVTTAFAGLVVTHEIAWHMDQALHAVTMIPGFSGQFILRELGVAIPALLLVSKVGAATTAEVGTMKVTEQIDALKLLGIDPVSYLVFPRFVAAIISSICLTYISIFVTLTCAIALAVLRYNFSILEYLNALQHFVGPKDLLCALVKGAVFGGVIPIISCTYGFRCKPGAKGVGEATTEAVVTETMVVISLDFFLTYLFSLVL